MFTFWSFRLRPPFPKGDKELPVVEQASCLLAGGTPAPPRVERVEDLRCGLPENNLTIRAGYAEWLKPLPRRTDPPHAQAGTWAWHPEFCLVCGGATLKLLLERAQGRGLPHAQAGTWAWHPEIPQSAALRAFLRERLGWPQPLPDVKAEKTGREEKGPWSAEFWILETEPGIRLPALRIGRKDARGNERRPSSTSRWGKIGGWGIG